MSHKQFGTNGAGFRVREDLMSFMYNISVTFLQNSELYEQTDDEAMGSLLGPLLANIFMCHIENQLEQKGMIPSFYRRYVDDT